MGYTVGQVAERLGITVYTLHYYDKEGLLPFVDRAANGARVFKDSDFRWLDIIMALKNTGMPLKDIKQYVEWGMAGDSTLTQRFDYIKRQKKVVENQMEKFKKYLELLDYKQWYYETAIEAGTTAIHKQTGNCRTAKRLVPEIYTAL